MDELLNNDDPRLRVDFVWGPVWGDPASEPQLGDHMPVNGDPRVRVWYDDSLTLHNAMAAYVEEAAPLIDQYFIFAPGSAWDGEDPGEPAFAEYGHVAFDAEGFLADMLTLVPDCEEVVAE